MVVLCLRYVFQADKSDQKIFKIYLRFNVFLILDLYTKGTSNE